MPVARLALATFAALAVACTTAKPTTPATDSGPPQGDADPDAPPFHADDCKSSLAAGKGAQLTVGKGQTAYLDIGDGDVLTWEKGPQGGHHVWIALRMIGLRQLGTITSMELDDIEDPAHPVVINKSRLVYDFTRDEGGHCTLAGLRMQLDNAGGPSLTSLVNHHIRVQATLDDPDGAQALGSKVIVVTGTL